MKSKTGNLDEFRFLASLVALVFFVFGAQRSVGETATPSSPTPVTSLTPERIVFCRAIVSRALSSLLEQPHQMLNSNIMKDVGIELLTAEDRSQIEAKYRNHPARPKLVVLKQFPPMIPFEMRAQHIEGRADCLLVIGKNGRVRDVYLADCTNKAYAQAIGLSLKSWRFAELDEECLVKVPMEFNLVPPGKSS